MVNPVQVRSHSVIFEQKPGDLVIGDDGHLLQVRGIDMHSLWCGDGKGGSSIFDGDEYELWYLGTYNEIFS